MHAGDLAQAAEGLDLAAPAARDAADLVVHRLVAVGGDRDYELRAAHAADLLRAGDDLVGEVAVGGEVEEDEVPAARQQGLADVDEVLAQPGLAAREVHPEEARRLPEEGADLVEPQLVARRHLPDVAGLAPIVAPERQAEGELVGMARPPEVRFEGAGGEGGVGRDAHHDRAFSSRRTGPGRG